MPNIATVLKAEVGRLARKELRSQTDGLRKTIASQRADIAALKRRLHELEAALKVLNRSVGAVAGLRQPLAAKAPSDSERSDLRFRAQGMANNRRRLGLSAADFGLLVGATGQSIYAWESGRSRPRAENLAAIASLRGLGKREVAERLSALKKTRSSK